MADQVIVDGDGRVQNPQVLRSLYQERDELKDALKNALSELSWVTERVSQLEEENRALRRGQEA